MLAGGTLYALTFSGRAAAFTQLSGVAASPATRVACGDFDGDGVFDVALGSPGGVVVHRQLPELD